MLRRIGLNNFKCFDRLDLPCAPLNLLCGLNGMGKSSVIQALLVLRQSFASGELRAGHLVLGGGLIDLGAGSDVLFEDADEEVIEFALDDERPRKPGEPGRCPVTGQPTGGLFAPVAVSAARSIFDRLLSGRTGEDEMSDGRLARDYPAMNLSAFRRALARARADGVERARRPSEYFSTSIVDVSWTGTFRYSRTGDQLTAVESEAADRDALSVWCDAPPFGGVLHYVQAERVGPRKSYPLSEVLARRGDLGARGEYAWNYLNDHAQDQLQADDPRRADAPGRRLVDVVDHWLQDVSPGAHLNLEAVMAADEVIAGFTFDRPGDVESRRHRATNVGFGLSYVLPVVLALLAPPGALCLVENPEAHLHPRGQTKLAELAARAAQAGVQVFVETHSDHFVDGVRIAVRDGLIPAGDAATHYFGRPVVVVGRVPGVAAERQTGRVRLPHEPDREGSPPERRRAGSQGPVPGMRAMACEAKALPQEEGEPLMLCAVTDGVAVGFPSEPIWDRDRITVSFQELLPNGAFAAADEAIDQLTRTTHAESIADRHVRRRRSRIETPADLWSARAEAFPHLTFGPDVEDQLGRLNPGWLTTVVNRLAELDEAASAWKEAGGPTPSWTCKVTPESESAMNSGKLREARRFRSVRGERLVFQWHARFGAGGTPAVIPRTEDPRPPRDNEARTPRPPQAGRPGR